MQTLVKMEGITKEFPVSKPLTIFLWKLMQVRCMSCWEKMVPESLH